MTRKRNVTANGLRHVIVGANGLDPRLGLSAIATFEHTHGTRDLEGRETLVRLTMPELGRLLGALPPVALGWSPKDTEALIHVIRKLDPYRGEPRALRVSHAHEATGERHPYPGQGPADAPLPPRPYPGRRKFGGQAEWALPQPRRVTYTEPPERR